LKRSPIYRGWPSAFSVMNRDCWNGDEKIKKTGRQIRSGEQSFQDHLVEFEGFLFDFSLRVFLL